MATDRVLINEEEASKMMGVKKVTLRKWRAFKKPPSFFKIGQRVFYDKQIISDYIDHCEKKMP